MSYVDYATQQLTSGVFVICAEFTSFALTKGEHLSDSCGFLLSPVPRFDRSSLGIDDETLQVTHCLGKFSLLLTVTLIIFSCSIEILWMNDPTTWLLVQGKLLSLWKLNCPSL